MHFLDFIMHAIIINIRNQTFPLMSHNVTIG